MEAGSTHIPEDAGGARGEPPRRSMAQYMALFREGWQLTPELMRKVGADAQATLDDPAANKRQRARAAQTLIAVGKLVMDAAVNEDRMHRLDSGAATENVGIVPLTPAQIRAAAATLDPAPGP